MAEFFFPPEWANAPPPELPDIDPDRLEGLHNGFLAATHDALHTSSDAFYRKTGQDAVDGVPALQAQLSQLRDAALDQAQDEGERAALAPRLDANLAYLQDGIDRHVSAQKQRRNRQIISERQTLTQRAAELTHNDDQSLWGFAEANANAAQELARLTGAPQEPAMLAARSAIWRGAIGQRLATGQGAPALELFDKIKDRLTPADQRTLEAPIQAARTDLAANQWIEREAGKDAEPPATRPSASLRASLQADAGLSPAERATVLAKIEARDSATESARVAAVKGLDDRLGATTGTLATQPAAYRPGTLAAIANAYDDAGESDKADSARRMALQESFLLPFARSNAAIQQRLIDGLPDGEDRTSAEAIQARQNEAFTKDAFSAGTALYADVGPPKPIDDLAGRIAQARTIAAYRGIPVAPFTADEMAVLRRQLTDGTPQQREALLAQLDALPEDMKAAIASTQRPLVNIEGTAGDGQPQDASLTQKPNAPVKLFPDMPDPTVPTPPKPPEPEPEPGQQRPFHRPLRITPPPPPPPPPDKGPQHEAPQPAPGNLVT